MTTPTKQEALEDEVWKEISNHENYYISSFGRVRGTRGIMCLQRQGAYFAVNIKRKRYLVHRLVASHFIGNIPEKMCVAHLDGNGKNNFYKNLLICTYKENERHKIKHGTSLIGSKNHKTNLSELDAAIIKYLYSTTPKGEKKKIADIFGITYKAMHNIAINASFKDSPCFFKFYSEPIPPESEE